MHRHLLAALLFCAAPLAAQTEAPATLRDGATVRVFLRDGAAEGVPGALVGGDADTLRVISPALGLARLPAVSIQRLETAGPRAGTEWKYAAMILGMSIGAGAGDEAGGGEFFPAFMNGLIAFTAGGAVLYAIQGPERRPVSVQPQAGLRIDPAGPGVPVRVATGALARAERRLHDFSADSLFLVEHGRITPLPRVELTSLQVSLGRDRHRGARRGARYGALGGAVLGGGSMALMGGWGLLMSPFAFVAGGALGGLVGYPVGWALAPRAWSDVPLQR